MLARGQLIKHNQDWMPDNAADGQNHCLMMLGKEIDSGKILEALRVFPGGDQVDGLPPAPSVATWQSGNVAMWECGNVAI